MTTTLEFTQEQVSKLRSLHFWNRNLIVAKGAEDTHEITKSRKAIQMLFEDADNLEIPFAAQNKVLDAARNNISFCDLDLSEKNGAFTQSDFDILADKVYNNGKWLYNEKL